jgi:hypothetical protein
VRVTGLIKMYVNGFKLVYTCHVMNGKFGALVAAKLCPNTSKLELISIETQYYMFVTPMLL